jgi:hypothetical protein
MRPFVIPSVSFVLVVVLFPLLTIPAQGQVSFFQPPGFSCNNSASVSADFNRDGKADLACADGTVLLGNGDGTFRQSTSLPLSGAIIIVEADFDGDGIPDLLLVVGTTLNIFLGNGDGTFQSNKALNTGTQLNYVAVADVNGDGKVDVLALSDASAGLFVFLGNGDGTLKPGTISDAGLHGEGLVTGDFNGDGKVDVATVTNNVAAGTSALAVLLGNGDGTFQSPIVSDSTTGSLGEAEAEADFNGDGKLDLVLSSTSNILVLLGNGDGTFRAPSATLPASGPVGISDFNGDGKLDIAAGGPYLVIFLGEGDGTFGIGHAYLDGGTNPYPGGSGSVNVADSNGDGKLDLATADVILLGNGDGTFRGSPVTLLSPPPICCFLFQAATGDFNGDGKIDAAVVVSDGVSILLNQGGANLTVAHTYALNSLVPSDRIAAADFNGDGKLDLVVSAAGSLNVLLGNGDGTFGMPIATAGSQGDIWLAVADFNGDHKPDVAIINSSSVLVFLGNGDGSFSTPVSYFAGVSPQGLAVADFNGDGKMDIAVSGSNGLAVLLGNGDGTFQSASFSNLPSNSYLTAADINGDGRVDLVASSQGGTQVFLGNGDGTFRSGVAGLYGGFAFVSDVNQSGKLDLVVSGNGVTIYLSNGDGTFSKPITVMTWSGFIVGGGVAAIADFTGDGLPDLAIFPESEGPVLGTEGLLFMVNTTAPGFQISASTVSPTSVPAGGSASSTITITPTEGFNQGVTLSCSKVVLIGSAATTAPPTCSFSPASVTNGSGTSKLTISTTGSSALLAPFSTSHSGLFYAMLLPIIGVVVGARFGPRRRKMLGLLTISLLMSVASCGGGGGSAGELQSTPAGTYTITVSGSAGPTVNATTVTLVVQ